MKKKKERDKKGDIMPHVAKGAKVKERDKKGRYAKGHKGGPGRTAGTIKDVLCKDDQKRSVATLIDDLLGAYATMGGGEFLAKWATQNHRNLTKFIDILYKFAPMPETGSMPGGVSYELSEKYMPKFIMPRPEDIINKRIMDLQDKLKKKDEELRRLKVTIDPQEFKELEHKPILPIELPEHNNAENQPEKLADEDLGYEVGKPGKRLKVLTTADINVTRDKK